MVQDCSASFTVEVEVSVACKIEYSRSISLSCNGKTKFVFLRPLIAGNCLESSGITHFAILAVVKEFYSTFVLAAFPDLVLEALRTTVKMVRTVVYRKIVLHPVKSEAAFADTVCKTSRHLAHTRSVAEIALRLSITEHHIRHIPVLVRNDSTDKCGTYIT